VRDDLELLDAWGGGDREAAAELLDRHVEMLARFFRGKAGAEVDDFVQEVFTRCLARRTSLEPGTSFRAYAFTIARNLLFEHYRKAGRRALFDPDHTSLADLGPTPSAVVHRDREQRLMMAAMRTIPLDSQIALELFYWEDLGVAEMAAVLAVPVGTVKSRLHRARTQLRAQLAVVGQGDADLDRTLSLVDDWGRDTER
jgi:RNA polymerase sigma factor (sigma-70 family)